MKTTRPPLTGKKPLNDGVYDAPTGLPAGITPTPIRGAAERPAVLHIAPRVIRFKDAPAYLGMDRNRFNAEVRPYVTEIRMGKQGVAFDRLDLDAWWDDYKSRNGRPGHPEIGGLTWDKKQRRVSSSVTGSGTSTSSTGAAAFAKALARVSSRKRRNT
jgi:hypothetical protein